MIQCSDCEYFHKDPSGQVGFACDPFSTVKEPECLAKWQLAKVSQLLGAYQSTLEYYRKLAPMQEKMFKVMEREIDDISEADKWKVDEEDEFDPHDQSGDDELWPG